MDVHQLNLDGCDVTVTDVVLASTAVAVRLTSTCTSAACPRCGKVSDRVHSRYLRKLADLACHNRQVLVRLQVRRFRCTTPTCSQSIFCERLPMIADPRARTTARLTDAHRLVGLALGGEAGSRLAKHLTIPTSPDTILRRVKDTDRGSAPPPRFVGIDDWAWRKGRRYGTIVVDLERGRVIDLLPDRNAETVKAWLAAHPGVELISRDRGASYIQAITEAAPQAAQVADRWHLLKNLREAIERLFERQSKIIGEALTTARADSKSADVAPETASEPAGAVLMAAETGAMRTESSHPCPTCDLAQSSSRQQVHQVKRQRRVERFNLTRELQRQGQSIRGIARELGMTRKAVRRYLRRETCPDWNPGRRTRSGLDAHRPWIDRWLEAGGTNAADLHRELASQGCRMSSASVRRYVTKRLAAAGKLRSRVNAAHAPTPALPAAKQLSFDWVRRHDQRKVEEQARLEAIRGGSVELDAALELADEFADLIRKQTTRTLADWLIKAESSKCPEMRRFAEGIRQDEAAVRAAVTEPWSNGPVEGHVNRLKLIKRQMYGRAGFQLLKARVVHAA
jgi:transposase